MGVLEGISQCWPLSEKCHVWWDAWAVIVAALAIGATLFLGYMTLRLGREANRAADAAAKASEAAVQIASEDHIARVRDAEDRRIMLLVWISGEVSGAMTVLRKRLSDVSEDAKSKFMNDAEHRHAISILVSSLRFPNAVAMASAMHAIGHPVAAQFARAQALITLMQEGFDGGEVAEDDVETCWGILTSAVPRVINDLDVVHKACIAAITKAGIKAAKVD